MSSWQGEKGRRKVVGKRRGRGHSLVPRPCSGYEARGDSETEWGGGLGGVQDISCLVTGFFK